MINDQKLGCDVIMADNTRDMPKMLLFNNLDSILFYSYASAMLDCRA